jgi:hypothetical protein
MINSKEFFSKIYNGKYILIFFQILALLLIYLYYANTNRVYESKFDVKLLFFNSLVTENKLNGIFLSNFKKKNNYLQWINSLDKKLENIKTNLQYDDILTYDDIYKIQNKNAFRFLETNEIIIENKFFPKDKYSELKDKLTLIEEYIKYIINISEETVINLVQKADLKSDLANSETFTDFQILNNFDSLLILSDIDIYNYKLNYKLKKIRPNIIYASLVISVNLFLLSVLLVLFRKR